VLNRKLVYRKSVLCVLGFSLIPVLGLRADQAVLIGGGYNINGSQGQIELNVRWVQDVLKQSELPVTTFFTDGDDPRPDVHYMQSSVPTGEHSTGYDQLVEQLEPLARLFGNHTHNLQRYRNHEVPDVIGSTQADKLGPALTDILKSSPDDPTLIVYNGHGRQSNTSTDRVTMELWNDTQMTASELHTILDNSKAPSRFVFTQCYSGGFHRLAYANSESGLELSSTPRCGFTAESAYRLAEGCSASIDTKDYRDYTTYFFAALKGYDRSGEILPVDTDTDRDGQISLREAHFYTLENAHSTDLSRSTSEDYLSTWQPWFLKWAAGKSGLPNNEYAKLFRNLAGRHGIPLNGNPAKNIRAKMDAYNKATSDLITKRDELHRKLKTVRQELINAAKNKWPSLVSPYTASFQTMAASGEMLQVAQWIEEQTSYRSLVELQIENSNITNSLLDAERNLTQMQKLLEFRKLAKIKHQLYQYGSNQQVKDYESLVSCESQPLHMSNTSAHRITENQAND